MKAVDSLKEYVFIVGSVENPELTTHLNYIHYIWKNTKKLEFNYLNQLSASKKISEIKFNTRVNLVKLTYRSLSQEAKQVESTREYARACSAWVAIKGYYLLFYLETILLSLIEAQNKLKATHGEVRKSIRNLSISGALTASFPELIEVKKHKDCEKTGLKIGANLKGQVSDADRYKQIMRKLREYSLEEYKRTNKLKRLSGEHRENFNKINISLSDFFYWYRIKSNYRDLEFIAGDGAKLSELYNFYKMFNQAVIAEADAHIKLINRLYSVRTNSNVPLF